jgi:hypothetical protein
MIPGKLFAALTWYISIIIIAIINCNVCRKLRS